ncbi:hypothetical protein A3742_14835, partial [Oleiphilus sp. HI0071]
MPLQKEFFRLSRRYILIFVVCNIQWFFRHIRVDDDWKLQALKTFSENKWVIAFDFFIAPIGFCALFASCGFYAVNFVKREEQIVRELVSVILLFFIFAAGVVLYSYWTLNHESMELILAKRSNYGQYLADHCMGTQEIAAFGKCSSKYYDTQYLQIISNSLGLLVISGLFCFDLFKALKVSKGIQDSSFKKILPPYKKELWFIGFALLITYSYSMFVHPFTVGSWSHVQRVWERWQSLNVGVLAFFSSIVIYWAATYSSNKQRQRNFEANRAFLPQALSDLTAYNKKCAAFLGGVRNIVVTSKGTKVRGDCPELPHADIMVFKECISFSTPAIGEHLAHILRKLQINHARLSALKDEVNDSTYVVVELDVISYVYGLGELQSLIDATFDFARRETSVISA